MSNSYDVTFEDGTTERVQAQTKDAAKVAAKNDRIKGVDPGREMRLAELRKHGAVKVARVTEVDDPDARK